MIQGLQEELITVRLREAENSTAMKNLHTKIYELEEVRELTLLELAKTMTSMG